MRLSAGMLLALGLVLQACTPLYVAPALNGPLLSEPGELHIAGAIEATSGAVDLDLAFAPYDYVALMGGMSYGSTTYDEDHEHTYAEFGAGTFVPFGIGRFEAFLGGGYGDARGDIILDAVESDDWIGGSGDYARFFCQADIGLELDFLEFGGIIRAAHVTFWHTGEDGRRRTVQEMFWEIGSFFRAGWKVFKFEIQAQFLIPTIPTAPIANNVFQIALGIHLAFDLY
ncbi:MAG: hypothetical protein JXR96_19100 [Deltaproteobacteria bacterium]|nr:hypothetical protein [Deltaproteobacteria bacterium]